MLKNILTVVGITVLFLGLAIQPSVATPQLKKIDVEPDVEGLVAHLRVVINEILQDYGHIPLVRSLCNTILDSLGMLGNIIICIFLNILIFLLLQLHRFIAIFGGYLSAEIGRICLIIIVIGYNFNCRWFFSYKSFKLPFQSIYSMLDTNDITNLVDECPCMQD